MAKGIRYTEGVLARDTTTSGGGVAFFFNRSKTPVVKTDVLKTIGSRGRKFGRWDADSIRKEWTAEQFEKTYGFLPRTGKTEEYYLQL